MHGQGKPVNQGINDTLLRGGIFEADALPGSTGLALAVFGVLLLLTVLVSLVMLRRLLAAEAKLETGRDGFRAPA